MRELKIEELELVAGGLAPQEQNKPPVITDPTGDATAAPAMMVSLERDPQEQNIPPQ